MFYVITCHDNASFEVVSTEDEAIERLKELKLLKVRVYGFSSDAWNFRKLIERYATLRGEPICESGLALEEQANLYSFNMSVLSAALKLDSVLSHLALNAAGPGQVIALQLEDSEG